VDEYGFVLDILLQRHRDTEAAKTFLTRLLSEYDVPEVIHTDQLRSYGAAIREIPSLADVDHQQVISTARCNNIIEQEHRSTRRQERSQQGFKKRKRAQEFLSLHARITNLHHHARTSVSAKTRRSGQASSRASVLPKKQPKHSVPDVVNRRGRGGLRFRPPLPSACRDVS
jgi:putative transposase